MIYVHVFAPVAVLARTGLFFLPDFIIGNVVHNTVFNTPSRTRYITVTGIVPHWIVALFPCAYVSTSRLFCNRFSWLRHCIPISSYQTTTLFACLLLRRPFFDVLTLFRARFNRTTLFAVLILC